MPQTDSSKNGQIKLCKEMPLSAQNLHQMFWVVEMKHNLSEFIFLQPYWLQKTQWKVEYFNKNNMYQELKPYIFIQVDMLSLLSKTWKLPSKDNSLLSSRQVRAILYFFSTRNFETSCKTDRNYLSSSASCFENSGKGWKIDYQEPIH